MKTKEIHLIECDSCSGSFSENKMGHYDTADGLEADYCNNCVEALEAQYA